MADGYVCASSTSFSTSSIKMLEVYLQLPDARGKRHSKQRYPVPVSPQTEQLIRQLVPLQYFEHVRAQVQMTQGSDIAKRTVQLGDVVRGEVQCSEVRALLKDTFLEICRLIFLPETHHRLSTESDCWQG